jgi:hypothetical protein
MMMVARDHAISKSNNLTQGNIFLSANGHSISGQTNSTNMVGKLLNDSGAVRALCALRSKKGGLLRSRHYGFVRQGVFLPNHFRTEIELQSFELHVFMSDHEKRPKVMVKSALYDLVIKRAPFVMRREAVAPPLPPSLPLVSAKMLFLDPLQSLCP